MDVGEDELLARIPIPLLDGDTAWLHTIYPPPENFRDAVVDQSSQPPEPFQDPSAEQPLKKQGDAYRDCLPIKKRRLALAYDGEAAETPETHDQGGGGMNNNPHGEHAPTGLNDTNPGTSNTAISIQSPNIVAGPSGEPTASESVLNILSSVSMYNKRFKTRSMVVKVKIPRLSEGQNIGGWLHNGISAILNFAMENTKKTDFLGLCFRNEDFAGKPAYLSYRRADQLCPEWY